MKISTAWDRVKGELRLVGYPCLNEFCIACAPLNSGIAIIDDYVKRAIELGVEDTDE